MGSRATSDFDEASVVARFDHLVESGTVKYSSGLEKIYYNDAGFEFEFRITPALNSKPAAVADNSELDGSGDSGAPGGRRQDQPRGDGAENGRGNQPEGCLPGGDIGVAGYELGQTRGGTHILSANKFCAYRPHLLLLTADGNRRQFEALGNEDFEGATEVLGGLNGWFGPRGGDGGLGGGGEEEEGSQEYLVIFNGGRDAGCSRLHKHMQIIPAPSAIPLWPDVGKEVPFRYLIHRFPDGVPGAEELEGKYREMLREAAGMVPGWEGGVEEDGNGMVVPHNVILGRRWIVVVPRRRAGIQGADVNAAGLLGVVWAAKREVVQRWKELGGQWVLGEVGVRK
ncbi:Diadenosine 5',5'''-P1,P4-tetraphosphate phosphorylase 2-like protein 1 [Colletotrichum chlorophyti]|uniref:Diadenosine 5',5'''-P1,P4-tetraphosphate phosphorylase 2-like protein 1 n=1 Tax=Colletotrichum chlorophyti TaxID=708187 RepID=A0A1Q8RNX6_9PEZI|nr:Diadenosine 5',5'''-P1,P4-tetraphosphate phosphorylase 2-like protein 1 [Colletotrichum chlorophyti]